MFTNNAQGYQQFNDWINTLFCDEQPLICMEATGAYNLPLAEFMVNQGYAVSVVNPAKIKAFASKADATLRKALYMPALVAWRHNPPIRTFCQRLRANGKNGKAIICAAMRKLIHLAFAILKSGQPFDPNFAV